MLTSKELQELEAKLLSVICRVCIEGDGKGKCKLWYLEQCPIKLHLPRLVETVETVDSRLMGDYVDKVRQDICTICPTPVTIRGECSARESKHCALDAYLLPIVQIIDDFLADRRKATTPAA